MKNIAVFFGGVSCEHDISIITGLQVLENLSHKKYNILPVYITQDGVWFLSERKLSVDDFIFFKEKNFCRVCVMPNCKGLFKIKRNKLKVVCEIDCAILACHGAGGEDGVLQGLLSMSGIPFTSSGVLGSAICMDKVVMKEIFKAQNFPITDHIFFTEKDYRTNKKSVLGTIKNELSFPVFVKPANLGSSIGINRCESFNSLEKAIDVAFEYDKKVIIEVAVENLKEINCACLGDDENVEVSSLEEPISWQNFLSFEEKYIHFSKVKYERKKALTISAEMVNKIKNLARTAFRSLCCSGVVRIDFLINSKTDEIYINEINTIPGSLSSYLWEDKTFAELLDELITLAIKNHIERINKKFCYKSAALLAYKNNKQTNKITYKKI